MHDSVSSAMSQTDDHELLYFWAFGDLHYRARDEWHAIHSRRMAPMFQDVRSLWLDEGAPAFYVAPGDIVDTGAPQNYTLAKKDLAAQLGHVPFYPGIGNHEFQPEHREDTLHTAEEFTAAWHQPLRYAWEAGEVICIMLDQPNPYLQNQRRENPHVIFTPESLAFLDTTLAEHAMQTAVIFAHCPLRDTVLDRDPERNLDDDSLDPFLSCGELAGGTRHPGPARERWALHQRPHPLRLGLAQPRLHRDTGQPSRDASQPDVALVHWSASRRALERRPHNLNLRTRRPRHALPPSPCISPISRRSSAFATTAPVNGWPSGASPCANPKPR